MCENAGAGGERLTCISSSPVQFGVRTTVPPRDLPESVHGWLSGGRLLQWPTSLSVSDFMYVNYITFITTVNI